MKRKYIIPVFVPHQGCPNSCVFCNQKSISGEGKRVTTEDARKTIDYYLNNFENDNVEKEIAFFGGSFTAIEKERQEELLEVAYEYIKAKRVSSIRISTRPDYIDKDILKFLKKYKVETIELGVQSANDYVLEKAKRGHTFEDVVKASKLIRRYGFTLGHQMMVGLPESTRQNEIDTAIALCKLKPKMIRIYPVLVVKNTELERMYYKGEYEPLTLEQAVDRSKEIYYIFNKKKISIIRLGLQNTDTISNPKSEKSEIVAGPFHPAFRQLVESSIWYDAMVAKIKNTTVKAKTVEISVNPENINNAIGHKRENIEKIKELYDVDVKVVGDEKIKPEKIELDIKEIYKNFLDEEDEKKKSKK